MGARIEKRDAELIDQKCETQTFLTRCVPGNWTVLKFFGTVQFLTQRFHSESKMSEYKLIQSVDDLNETPTYLRLNRR